ncbi:MAG: hypothetical protein QNK37_36440 [Acidobacteriota bacterium]|nr:hypothetical protein [Acidobacteriota bacterium]
MKIWFALVLLLLATVFAFVHSGESCRAKACGFACTAISFSDQSVTCVETPFYAFCGVYEANGDPVMWNEYNCESGTCLISTFPESCPGEDPI